MIAFLIGFVTGAGLAEISCQYVAGFSLAREVWNAVVRTVR
ncbi:hypothetical protein [Allopusillimonas ginsengisoli]|nr:hypothetical protein [Allopusillimonas ginsengisoli]